MIEDERHAEGQGRFLSVQDAMIELRRRAQLPWNEKPNVAPCTNWEKCGRAYEVVEYDDTSVPWTEIRRTRVLEVSASGVTWSPGFEEAKK